VKPLGRRVPTDWRHLERFPLRAVPTALLKPSPVVFGVNWYTNFDDPEKVGNRWFIGRGSLGSVRGGHAICSVPKGVTDTKTWWAWYDQGQEGACVGFACSRAQSLNNRRRYNAQRLYEKAQEIDEFADTPPEEGTSVRAGMEVMRLEGLWRRNYGVPEVTEGISAYRWATTVDEVLTALDREGQNAIPLVNSWGTTWPHVCWLPNETLARLLDEDGECAVPTDR